MKRLFTSCLCLPFWASPNNSIYDLILRTNGWSAERRAKSLDPGFPRDDPVEDPPTKPVRPIPTDVPSRDPKDIPVKEPRDVPPPSVVPKPIQPLPQRPDPKPRTTP